MSLSQAIISTLKYSSYFSFPLKMQEISSRLIYCRASLSKISQELRKLVKSGQVETSKGFYYLPGEKSLVNLRQSREIQSRSHLHRARILASQLSLVPGVLAFYLTGSLAVNNITKDGDIDFLVVSYPHKLWITRFFLTFITTLLGLRRTPSGSNLSDKLCLNLYLTPDSFTVPVSRRSLYTAYELIQAKPLFDPLHTYPYLLAANSWIKKYLPNYQFPPIAVGSLWNIKTPQYIKWLESLAYHLQYFYMKSRITREWITRDCAYFHPHNPGDKAIKDIKLITKT